MQLTKNFQDYEFSCPCCGQSKMHMTFMLYLQAMRNYYKKPIIITSGFRCEVHNTAIGGSPKSQHMKGKAADIRVHTVEERYELIDAAIKCGFRRIGVYSHHIHVDIKPTKSMVWVGVSK